MSDPSPPGAKAHAVTGAFGFSGKYLTRRLLDAGKRVVTLTGSPHKPHPFGDQITAHPFAFSDPKAMAESLRGVEVLYNTYWVRFNHTAFNHAAAVRNTLALFEAARLAAVERVVHVSITGADARSPLEYFSCKGMLEKALKESGLNYAIVRPALLFGEEDILVNNMAWAVRRFPVLGLIGDGSGRLQPIYVDDLAALMVEQGKSREAVTVNALGPEDYSFRGLLELLARILGKKRCYVPLSPNMAERIARLLGTLLGDVLITREEMEALMGGYLHVPGEAPAGSTRLSEWAGRHSAEIGKVYHSELDRRSAQGKL